MPDFAQQLNLLQQVAIGAIVVVGLAYGLYCRIWAALAKGADLVFALSLVAAAVAVLSAAPFEAGAARMIDASPLPGALESADDRLDRLEKLPGALLDSALEAIGFDPEPEPVAATPPGPGPIESTIRPAVEGLIANILRGTTCVLAAVLLVIGLVLRSSTATVRELDQLRRRLDALEA